MPSAPRSFGARLALIAGAALALRVLFTVVVAQDYQGIGDFFYYHGIANDLADGRGFIDPFRSTPTDPYPSALHPPLWSLALAAGSELGGNSFLAHRLVGAVPGTGTVILLGLLGRRLAGDRAGLIAAALAAAYPVFLAADASLMSETLYGTCVAGILVLSYRLVDRPSAARAAWLGAVIGLAALTRGEGVLFLPFLALPLAWRGARNGRALRLAAVVAGAAIVIAPWTIRNWIQFDHPILISTNEATVIAGANCASVYSGQNIGLWDVGCISDIKPGLDEREQTAIWRREGRSYAEDHVGRLAVVAPVRILRTWGFFHPRQQINMAEGGAKSVKYTGAAVYYLLLALAAFGAVLLHRRRATLLVMLSPFVVVTITSALSFGLPRFRQGAEIAIVALAAVALDGLLARRSGTAPEPVTPRSQKERDLPVA